MAQVRRKAVRMASKKEISPKVWVPAVVQLVAAIVLIVLGTIPGLGIDDETRSHLQTWGFGLLSASALTGGIGFQASPGQVVVNE